MLKQQCTSGYPNLDTPNWRKSFFLGTLSSSQLTRMLHNSSSQYPLHWPTTFFLFTTEKHETWNDFSFHFRFLSGENFPPNALEDHLAPSKLQRFCHTTLNLLFCTSTSSNILGLKPQRWRSKDSGTCDHPPHTNTHSHTHTRTHNPVHRRVSVHTESHRGRSASHRQRSERPELDWRSDRPTDTELGCRQAGPWSLCPRWERERESERTLWWWERSD